MLALLLAIGLGQAPPLDPGGPVISVPSIVYAPPLVSFAPPSGSGLPVAQTLCAQFTAAELDGGWCLNGDATMAAGSSITLADAGTTTGYVVPVTMCPSGPDCASRSAVIFAAASGGAAAGQWGYEALASSEAPAGAYTLCCHLSMSVGVNQNVLHLGTGSGTSQTLWQAGASGVVDIWHNSVLRRSVTVTLNAPHVLCETSDAIGTGQAYLDGAAVGATYTATMATGSHKWRVSGYQGGSYPLFNSSRVLSCSMTLTDKSAAMSAVARTVLADRPTTVRGDYPLVVTRATAADCSSATDGTGSVLPSGRACIRNGALLSRPGRTNYLTQSRAVEAAPWGLGAQGVALPIVTANYALAHDGTFAARRVQFPACPVGGATGDYSLVSVNANPGAGSYSQSLRAKATSTACTISICPSSTGGTTRCTPCTVPAGRWTTPSECSDANHTVTVTDGYAQFGCVNRTGYPGSSNTGACDLLLSEAQMELGAEATDPIHTEGATAARAAEYPTFTGLAGAAFTTQGSYSADFTPVVGNASAAGPSALWGTGARSYYSPADVTGNLFDGTNTTTRNHGWTVGTEWHGWTSWAGASANVANVSGTTNAGQTVGVFDGALNPTGDLTWCGDSAVLAKAGGGECSNLCLDPKPGRCAR